jgi:hypothetical protein
MTGKRGERGCATRQHFKSVVGKKHLLHLQQNVFQTKYFFTNKKKTKFSKPAM